MLKDNNGFLAGHPTIQVNKIARGYSVGLIGILNGIFGATEYGFGAIAGVYDEEGRLIRFKRTR